MAEMQLLSRRYDAPDVVGAIELCYERGWTDGLPVVPPEEGLVRRMLAAAQVEPQEVVGRVPLRRRTLTAEKVAINAVMAGCLPEYFPVVLAAVAAMADDRFHLHGSMLSTGGAAPLLIVNGPAAPRLGFNAGGNVFGPGWRANATVGRALRLVLINGCGARPGTLDRATLGHPGKFSYCIAEDEAQLPPGWPPLHVERGLEPGESAVTVVASEGPHHVADHASNTPEALLDTIARALQATGEMRGCHVLVVSPEHRAILERARWSKANVRAYLAGRVDRLGPDDLFVVAAGGEAGGFSAVIPPWVGGRGSQPVTRAVADERPPTNDE
ncbi:MAG: hypothetical protein HY332_13345 [Chloroflexi bacterium]|nr:hypothetical protein [Chloroflexota bacterium]